ncbi:MAG: hypothetical protein ABFD07_17100 [Methanobacterium sp.]
MDLNPSLKTNIDKLLLILDIVNRGAVIIAVCNNTQLQNDIISLIQNKCENHNLKLISIRMDRENRNLIKYLKADSMKNNIGSKVVYSITGMESIDALLQMNLKRDFFYEFKYPVIFWVNSEVLRQMMFKAPDLWHIRTKMIEFETNESKNAEIMFNIQGWKSEDRLHENMRSRALKSKIESNIHCGRIDYLDN